MLPSVEPAAAGYANKTSVLSIGFLVRYLFHRLSLVQWRRLLSPTYLIGWENTLRRSSDTSWLDGLRGFAAIQVYFYHFFGRYVLWGHTFGSSPDDYYIHQLPIFRSIYFGGPAAVSVFFVVSGYSITVKSFRLIRERRRDDLFRSLCSSLFRRGFRLYMPIILVSLPVFVLMRVADIGWVGYMYATDIKPTIGGQIIHFIRNIDDHVNPFAYKGGEGYKNYYPYVTQTWTIPLEYYGSIVCYLMVMLVSPVDVYRVRFFMLAGTAFYSIHKGSWWTSNFVIGMIIADYSLEQKERATTTAVTKNSKLRRDLFWFAIFFAGWYLQASVPKEEAYDFSPVPRVGYEFLYPLTPPKSIFNVLEDNRWWWYTAGNLTVLGISQVSWLRAIFDTKFCQWLGKLSYSLYLVHFIILTSSVQNLETVIHTVTEYQPVVILFTFSIITATILVASAFTERYMDQPSITFAKWLERLATQKPNDVNEKEMTAVTAAAVVPLREEGPHAIAIANAETAQLLRQD